MKFDMGTAWREAMAMISRNREVLLVVAGIFFFLPSVVLGFTVGDVQEAMLADPENARAVLISTYSQWSWLFALVTLVGAIGYLALLGELTTHMVIATLLGVFFTFVLGAGLFALAFFSDKSGHDQSIDDATRTEREHH